MEGASADASSGPEQRQLDLNGLEGLGTNPLLSGEGVDQEPVVLCEPELIERVGQRVHEP